MNPLLHPIDTINLQIEILAPKSSYICLIFVHSCCCHVVQVPTTSDLGPCNTAFSSLVASPNPSSILQSTDFTKYGFWLRSALLSIPHCLSAPDSLQDPRTLLLKTSFLTSLQSYKAPTLSLCHSSTGETTYLFHSHIFDSCYFFLLITTFSAKLLSLVNSLLRLQLRRPFLW